MVALVHRDANLLYMFAETVVHAMILNGTFCRAPTMLSVHGVAQMPLDVRLTRHEWHIIQVIDLQQAYEYMQGVRSHGAVFS